MISNEELGREQKYLNKVVDTLEDQIQFLNNSLYDQEKNLQETSEYMASSFYGSDAEEHAVAKQAMEELQLGIIALAETRNLKERQKQSAYFGRIDFWADDEQSVLPYYIGIAHIGTADKPLPLVLDWRAPLSSMYYDFELGDAKYSAPMGEITGKITLKRQYKTLQRELVYAFDSSLTIGDEILKAELGKNASAKMKNIVATIQKEQNQIIRAPLHENMVVQGVAGSGKTSIALHRVAYLLYTNKIKSSDILIVSPSGIFSDYISNVLPELGESNTPKITFEEIAEAELFGFARFEPKSQMLEDILAGNQQRALDVQTKASQAFFDNLKTYLDTQVALNFKAKDIKVGTTIIKAKEIEKLYSENYQTKNPAVRIEWIADYVLDRLEVGAKNQKAVFQRVKKVLFTMFESTDIVALYEDFLKTQNMSLNKVQIGKDVFLGFEDVPSLLYIKNFLLGVEIKKHFKHIIIDEMQDYSLIALDILKTIYTATKREMFVMAKEEMFVNKFVHWFGRKMNVFPVKRGKQDIESIKKSLKVLKDNKIIAGLGVIENDFHERKDLTPNVCAVYVEEEYRNLGIAGKMLNYVCEDYKNKGVRTLYLVTNHIGFYERYGWVYLCPVMCDGEDVPSRMYMYK